jgi:hypothetical protein
MEFPNGILLRICSDHCVLDYSLMNMRKIHIFFNQAKTWQLIVCLLLFFPCSYLNLPLLHQKVFCFDVQNIFWHKRGKFRREQGKHKSKQTITYHFLA